MKAHFSFLKKLFRNLIFKKLLSPGQVAQLVGVLSCTEKVEGLIPCQDTRIGWGCDPWPECIQEATNRCFSLSLPSPLSRIRKCILR